MSQSDMANKENVTDIKLLVWTIGYIEKKVDILKGVRNIFIAQEFPYLVTADF